MFSCIKAKRNSCISSRYPKMHDVVVRELFSSIGNANTRAKIIRSDVILQLSEDASVLQSLRDVICSFSGP